MKVERFLPPVVLRPFIKDFLIIESVEGTDSKIIPDASMVMAFRYKGRVIRKEGEQKETLSASVITGLRRSARILTYEKATANLLVIFNEGGIAAFAGVPAHELFDLSIAAENIFLSAELNEIQEGLAEAASNKERVDLAASFFLQHLVNNKQDALIAGAVQLIRQQNGMIRIRDLAKSLHISQDPLEKKFRALVGASPKQYASIIRLRSLIKNYPSYSSLTEASYEAGYFDQSHFIKDFRLFTGQTPRDFFKSPLYW